MTDPEMKFYKYFPQQMGLREDDYQLGEVLSLKSLNVSLFVRLSVCHTCYNCSKALNFKVFRLKDFCRTSAGLLKDSQTPEGLLKDFQWTSEGL